MNSRFLLRRLPLNAVPTHATCQTRLRLLDLVPSSSTLTAAPKSSSFIIISAFLFFNSFLLLDLCHKPRLRHQCLGIKLWPHLKFYINFSVLTRTRDAGRGSGKFSGMRLLHKLTSHKMCTEGFGAAPPFTVEPSSSLFHFSLHFALESPSLRVSYRHIFPPSPR